MDVTASATRQQASTRGGDGRRSKRPARCQLCRAYLEQVERLVEAPSVVELAYNLVVTRNEKAAELPKVDLAVAVDVKAGQKRAHLGVGQLCSINSVNANATEGETGERARRGGQGDEG